MDSVQEIKIITALERIAAALEAHRDLGERQLEVIKADQELRRDIFARASEEKKAEKETFKQLASMFDPAVLAALANPNPAVTHHEDPPDARPARVPRTRRPHTTIEDRHQ